MPQLDLAGLTLGAGAHRQPRSCARKAAAARTGSSCDAEHERRARRPGPTALQAAAAAGGRRHGADAGALLQAQGGFVDRQRAAPSAGWRGTLQQLELRARRATQPAWLRTRDVDARSRRAGRRRRRGCRCSPAAPRCSAPRCAGTASPGRPRTAARRHASMPRPSSSRWRWRRCWRALQPDFGWGGDLRDRAAASSVRSAPSLQRRHRARARARRPDA